MHDDPIEVPVFDETLKEVRFTDLSQVDSHAAAVSENGQIYTWGDGTSGQLGLDRAENFNSPTLLRSIGQKVPILQVSCGGSHTLCLDLLGRAHSWGANESG